MAIENVNVSVSTDSPPAPGAIFGVPALAALPAEFGAGFTERVRYYTSAPGVTADITSGDISAALGAALLVALSQTLRPSRIGVIRMTQPGAQVVTFTVGGTVGDGDVSEITINGISEDYAAVVPTDDAAAVAAALRSALTTALAAEDVTVSGSGANVVITADAETFFEYSSSATGTTTVTEVLTEDGLDIAADLSAALAESSAWYGFAFGSRVHAQILTAAAWAEANERIYWAQSNDAGILGSGSADIASALEALAYNRTLLTYYSDDAVFAEWAWLAFVSQSNPDVSTTAAHSKTLVGVAADAFTATQVANIEGKNGNRYDTMGGLGATWPGKMASGRFWDIQLTLDWVTARMREALWSLISRVANRNEKIPYTNAGIAMVAAVIEAVLARGVAAGHFAAGTTNVIVDDIADIDSSDKTARLLRVSWSATLTGAIMSIDVSGYASIT